MEDKILVLKLALQKFIDETSKNNNYMVGLVIQHILDEQHFITQSFLYYMYNNNIFYYKNTNMYSYKDKILYYYDKKNKILYLDINLKLISLNIISLIKNIIIMDNDNDNHNNILYITFGNNQPNINNKIIRLVQKYYSIIYITNYGGMDINILSEYNSFIFYRKLIYKFNNINNNKIVIDKHKIINRISSTHYIGNKQIKYNKLLYTFISLIIILL